MLVNFGQVALGGRTTGLSPAGAGLQAPAAALGPLAAGEVIGCGAVWRAGDKGQQRQNLEIFFHRDGLLVGSISGHDLGALMLRRQVFPTCFQRNVFPTEQQCLK
jgi:hypothetical protein